MGELTNEIVLRPHFELSLKAELDHLKSVFDTKGKDPFVVKRLDEHVYIRFKRSETDFWTPQLHLELTSFEKGKTVIHGVFGPNPRLWTFFMFLHFGVATLFVILAIFAYSKHSLGHDITFWVIGLVLLVLLWFAFYAFGRFGKARGRPQMHRLRTYLGELVAGFGAS